MTLAVPHSEALFAGTAAGPLLTLTAPFSFWGGVDRKTGTVINQRHPQCGESLCGRVVHIETLIGSSSSSAVLLELVMSGTAPAAILIGAADAILVMGCLAARELGAVAPPLVVVRGFPAVSDGAHVTVDAPVAGEPARFTLL